MSIEADLPYRGHQFFGVLSKGLVETLFGKPALEKALKEPDGFVGTMPNNKNIAIYLQEPPKRTLTAHK